MQDILGLINDILWHDYVLFIVLGTGVLFTVWSAFSQYRALTHGTAIIRGKYDDKDDPGAINHFQALSTALSATVGLGNIGGVALAIGLGGPGAVFWMWMVGLFGMAIKTTEVTLSMLYRNTDDRDNPHGGPMWVVSKGLEQWSPALKPLGVAIGGIFCITLLISTVTGGNMFQAWNVAQVTNQYFPTVPQPAVGIILAVLVGLVIIGGIRRIGQVAGKLVPFMCVMYMLAAILVVVMKIDEVPAMFRLIFVHAFSPTEATGAFIGGTVGFAFLMGMKRALFSSEAGQGSAPIAHSAAKTDEPVREGIVAGLEPFIDTIVVCTLTTMVILLSGAWNRGAETELDAPPQMVLMSEHVAQFEQAPQATSVAGEVNLWTLESVAAPPREDNRTWRRGDQVFTFTMLPDLHGPGQPARRAVPGRVEDRNGVFMIQWEQFASAAAPVEVDRYVYSGNQATWSASDVHLPRKPREIREYAGEWRNGNRVFMIVEGHSLHTTGSNLHTFYGDVYLDDDDEPHVTWGTMDSTHEPQVSDLGVYGSYPAASLTAHGFDRVWPGLGMWLVTIAAWLFAISTMIAWSYYGEQGVVYLVGERGVLPYKLIYCLLIVIATLGLVTDEDQLDLWIGIGTGVMLFANIPIMLLLGHQAMKAYHDYMRRFKSGEMDPPHKAPPFTDVVEGKDVK